MALKSTVISKKLLSPVSDNITIDFVFVYDIMLVFTVSTSMLYVRSISFIFC